VAKDVLTFLFDRPKALESLAALEQQWGGTLAERTARRAALIKGAGDRRAASA
jgi:penicillin-binding protein 2